MALSKKAKRGLVVALGYREDLASEFETALFAYQPISDELKVNIIDAMAKKSEALEVIRCLETNGSVPLSEKARKRMLQMLAGRGNDSTQAAIDEIMPLMLGDAAAVPALNILGTASTYAILAASAITNTGASVINGDVGIFPGSAITAGGWTVNGTVHQTDAAAMQAQVDALAAYNYLIAQSTTVIPSALDGQVLSAGAYSFTSGAATLADSGNGTLTLNGSATDIFIIKTATTLGTGAGGIPTITLTGGALSKNVY